MPAPLPPSLVYDPELVRALSRADSALSELSGAGRTEHASAQAKSLLDLREEYRQRFGGKVRLLALVDALFENPYLTALRAAQVLGVTQPTARREIAALEATGDSAERTGRAWGRVWTATRIAALLRGSAGGATDSPTDLP